MTNLNSAPLREETPQISDALKRRAQSIINDKSIDGPTQAIIRSGLEINDPWLSELVRCVDVVGLRNRSALWLLFNAENAEIRRGRRQKLLQIKTPPSGR